MSQTLTEHRLCSEQRLWFRSTGFEQALCHGEVVIPVQPDRPVLWVTEWNYAVATANILLRPSTLDAGQDAV